MLIALVWTWNLPAFLVFNLPMTDTGTFIFLLEIWFLWPAASSFCWWFLFPKFFEMECTSKILKSAGMDFVERLGPQPEICLQAHSNLELIWLDLFFFFSPSTLCLQNRISGWRIYHKWKIRNLIFLFFHFWEIENEKIKRERKVN